VAQLEAQQEEVDSRISSEAGESAAEIEAARKVADAQISQATTSADTQISVATISTEAEIKAALIDADALIKSTNLNGSNEAADLVLTATKYDADKSRESGAYVADSQLAAGTYTQGKEYDGTVYSTIKKLDGSRYTSDEDTETTQAVAEIRSDASKYDSQKQYEGTLVQIEGAELRQQMKLDASDAVYNQIWAGLSGIVGNYPTVPRTPGYDPNVPFISQEAPVTRSAIEQLQADTEAMVREMAQRALDEQLMALERDGLSPYGELASRIRHRFEHLVAWGGVNGRGTAELVPIEPNMAQRKESQGALVEQTDQVNKIALAAEANLVALQTAALAVLPRIAIVNQGP
jgi:hypothetical protein